MDGWMDGQIKRRKKPKMIFKTKTTMNNAVFFILLLLVVLISKHTTKTMALDYSLPTTTTTTTTTTTSSTISSVNDFGLIHWLTLNGGIFNPKQELRFVVDDDNHNNNGDDFSSSSSSSSPKNYEPSLGIFAKETIQKGEVLFQIPFDLMIGPSTINMEDNENDENDDDINFFCQTVHSLADEINKLQNKKKKTNGEENESSKYEPYIMYLSSWLQSGPMIPSAWSDVGRALFTEILGGVEQDILPPMSAVSIFDDIWYDECNGNETLLRLAGLVKQKSVGDFLVPIYDLYTHRNGKYYNVQMDFEDGEYLQLIARRKIHVGEQLHNSYDRCDDCNVELYEDIGYGTAEIFRDYGILERYPQRFYIRPGALILDDEEEDDGYIVHAINQIDFELVLMKDIDNDDDDDDENKNNNKADKNNGLLLQVEWAEYLNLDTYGRNYIRRTLRQELRRLYRLQNILYDFTQNDNPYGIPKHEWDNIRKYFFVMKNAMKHAVFSLNRNGNVNDKKGGDNTDAEGDNEKGVEEIDRKEVKQSSCGTETSNNDEGVCSADSMDIYEIHYDDLGNEDDNLDYILPDCEHGQLVEYWEYQGLEELKTNYQDLAFVQRMEDGDVCMNLETTLQICGSYRPHYHEFSVHYPARYIDEIKRVVFIGGGDSMLLHETLKYPTLEKVVGLELDQQVTRKSFKYFHTQPHFDNDKVEWWYGDATKSLPLLPKDYWGSFDLVLVDLSETVMSMSVTDELDIFAALSLLLKPKGIMVKNELYLEEFSQFFDYSIQVFYGSPKVCTQVMVMGSNQIDFLHHPVKDHEGIERLLLEPLGDSDDEEVRFKYMHDYLKTDARSLGKCKNSDEIGVKYGNNKAGILEIVDVENIKIPLKKEESENEYEDLEGLIREVIIAQGLELVTELPTVCKKGVCIFVMKEGYIVVRSWPMEHYCAIDINLWGSYQKQESIRAALIDALGSNDASTFKIVVGGMHGTSTWENDKDVIGIQVTQTRNCNNNDDDDNEQQLDQQGEDEHDSLAATSTTSTTVDDDNDSLKVLAASLRGLLKTFFVSTDSLTILVACGYQDVECPSLKILSSLEKTAVNVGKVEVIWTCPELRGDDDNNNNNNNVSYKANFEEMYECEKSIHSQMQEKFGQDDMEVDIFILDSTVPYFMAQIYQSIWSMPLNREEWLALKHLFVVPILNHSETQWRQNFVERYRKLNHPVPVSRTEIEVRTTTTTTATNDNNNGGTKKLLVSLGLFASDDRYFFHHLNEYEKILKEEEEESFTFSSNHGEEKKKLYIYTNTIRGGVKYFNDEYRSKPFEPASYDASPAIEQASSQKPLGRQSVFQFEFAPSMIVISDEETEEKDKETTVTGGIIDNTDEETSQRKRLDFLLECLKMTFEKLQYDDVPSSSSSSSVKFRFQKYDTGLLGEGGVIVSVFGKNGDNLVLVWDGRSHVDINLFSHDDDKGDRADSFVTMFASLSGLQRTLRDDQPRGTGRVIQFLADV